MKRILIAILFLQIPFYPFSQVDEDRGIPPSYDHSSHYSDQPVTPDIAEFQEVTFFNKNLANGTVNIQIPIFTIDFNNIKIPIGIAYNTSGIKINTLASNVGTGWSLTGQAMITRVIAGGRPDCQVTNHKAEIKEGYYWKKPLGPEDFTNSGLPQFDGGYDNYILNAPGIQSEFCMKRDGTNSSLEGPVGIESVPLIINGEIFRIDSVILKIYGHEPFLKHPEPKYYDGVNHEGADDNIHCLGSNVDFAKIAVTSSNGYHYIFSQPEWGMNYGSISQGCGWYGNIGSLLLKEIVDNNGNKIIYEYEEVENLYASSLQLNGNYASTWDFQGQFTSEPMEYQTMINSKSLNSKQRLKRITHPKGEVLFVYETLRKDINNKALTRIEIKNSNNIANKTYTFDYIYSYDSNGKESRLFLQKITEKDRFGNGNISHKFNYNEGSLPNFRTLSYDMYGYYNNRNNQHIPLHKHVLAFNLYKYSNNTYYPIQIPNSPYTYEKISEGIDLAPDESSMKIGMLNKITYSTGGSLELEYEGNDLNIFDYSFKGGGLRVKTQKKDNSTYYSQNYTYLNPICFIPRHGASISGLDIIYLENQANLNMFKGCPVLYKKTIEHYNNNNNNGQIVRIFTDYDDEPATLFGDHILNNYSTSGYPFIKKSNSHKRGLLKEMWVINSEDKIQSVEMLNYNEHLYLNGINNISVYSAAVSQYHRYLPAPFATIINYTSSDYKLSEKTTLDNLNIPTSSISIPYNNYNTINSEPLFSLATKNKVSYTYNSYGQLASKETTNSQNELLKTTYKYPSEYINFAPTTESEDVAVLRAMISKNMIGSPVEVVNYKNDKVIGGQLTLYKNDATGVPRPNRTYNLETGSPLTAVPLPENTTTYTPSSVAYSGFGFYFFIDNFYVMLLVYDKYDTQGNPLQYHKTDDIPVSYIWGYNNTYPIAKIDNAINSKCAYLGFEEVSATLPYTSNGWKILANGSTSTTAKTGDKGFLCGNTTIISTNALPVGTYRLSFYAQKAGGTSNYKLAYSGLNPSAVSIYNVNLDLVSLELTFTTSTTLSITFTGVNIDDLKLYPIDAQMTTYTYDPLIGMTSETAPNGVTTYYDYDNFGRLQYIKDQDGNILKQYDYHYANQ